MRSWLRPEESLAYNYEGYLEFTHLVGLPHIHIAESVHRLRRRRIRRRR